MSTGNSNNSNIKDKNAGANDYENIDQLLSSILGEDSSADESDSASNIGNADTVFDESEDALVSEHTSVFDFENYQARAAHFADEVQIDEQKPEKRKKNAKKHKRRRRKRNYTAYGGIVLATIVLCASVLISLFIIVVIRDVMGIETNDNEFTIYIPEGSSTSDIADMLYDEGVILYKEVFIALAKLKSADGNMYPGDIDVAYNMSYADIIDDLMEMREAKSTVTLTFPEGITLYTAAKMLDNAGVCDFDEFIYYFNSSIFGFEFEKYVSSASLKLYKYEGFLFPDTYEFYVGDSAYNVVKKIKTRTDEILTSEVINRASEIGMSLEDVIILASIVQKEAGSSEDMPMVASVFINRLNSPEQFPRLQSDATSAYVDSVIAQVMSVSSQEMCDAYDTYTCLGLPIGAICNPGVEAINAVLYHSDTDYYYFCTDSVTGEAYYASTYDEHLENCEIAGLV